MRTFISLLWIGVTFTSYGSAAITPGSDVVGSDLKMRAHVLAPSANLGLPIDIEFLGEVWENNELVTIIITNDSGEVVFQQTLNAQDIPDQERPVTDEPETYTAKVIFEDGTSITRTFVIR